MGLRRCFAEYERRHTSGALQMRPETPAHVPFAANSAFHGHRACVGIQALGRGAGSWNAPCLALPMWHSKKRAAAHFSSHTVPIMKEARHVCLGTCQGSWVLLAWLQPARAFWNAYNRVACMLPRFVACRALCFFHLPAAARHAVISCVCIHVHMRMLLAWFWQEPRLFLLSMSARGMQTLPEPKDPTLLHIFWSFPHFLFAYTFSGQHFP